MKHFLVDTIVLLPMHQGDADVLGDVKRELNNAVLVLLDSIIYEAAHKKTELEGNDGAPNFDDFVASLSGTLGSAGIKFKFVRLMMDMQTLSKKMFDEAVYPDLSITDCTLLLATMKRQNMDVMTDDKALIGAINAERGQNTNGKIRSVMITNYGRRTAVKWIVKRSLDKFIPKDTIPSWTSKLKHTEFFIGETKIASVDHKDGTTSVDLLGVVKKSNTNLRVLQHKLAIQIEEEFLKWKPGKGKGDSAAGPAKKKDWHGEHKNDDVDGLGEAQRKSVARKLRSKRIEGLDI